MKQFQHLRPLRKRLARLRRRRQRFRWATAASALAIAVLWALAGVFALDWYFQRNVDLWQRLMLLVLAAAAVIWAIARFTLPWLGRREDVADMAVLVQRQAGIDSDLVAALQFESPKAASWGSTALETVVIDRVAAQQKDFDVMAAMPRQPLARRLKVLLASVVLWALLGYFVPEHLRVFFQRLAFGSQHYPTQTRVVAVSINGTNVDLTAPGAAAVRVPGGRPIRFEVAVEGSQPASGRVEVFTASAGPAATVSLDPPPEGNSDQAQARYEGKYAGLSQSAHYQVYVGDAWTDPLELDVIALPAVEIEAEVVPPVYARQSADELRKLPRGMRQFAVLAGSEVRLKLDSDRPLDAVEVKFGERKADEVKFGAQIYPMQCTHHAPRDASHSAANGAEVWTLPTAGTPLASVAKELPYSIQVRDAEGQSLEQPLQGTVTLEANQPPGIVATTKTTLVVPAGAPNIHYEAADDHALGHIWLTWEATTDAADVGQANHEHMVPEPDNPSGQALQPDHSAGDPSPTTQKREGRIEIPLPPGASPRSCQGDYRLPLQSLPLKPGDTLKVTFHVSDFRGPAPAEIVDADPPLVFQVTDLHGFEASMYDSDQKTDGGLEDMRKKYSGLGDKP